MVDILVAGAGIGGTTVARLLARAGHRVTLLERASGGGAPGAGLVLTDTSLRTLAAAGVDVRPAARALPVLQLTGPDGRGRGGVRGRSALTRPDLAAHLTEGLDGLVDVRLGEALTGLHPEGSGVVCVSGPEGARREHRVDLVVGADGLRSTVRRTVDPTVPLRSAGQVCWRGIVHHEFGDRASELWTGRDRVGIVPLTAGRSYVFVVRPVDPGPPDLSPVPGVPGREAAAVRALQALPPAELLRHDLLELDRPVWGTGRVLLLGDAAHAMTPNTGLGAAFAIEDAVALVRSLADGLDGVTRRYRSARHRRVRTVQLVSRAAGRLAHSPHPAARRVRRSLGLQVPGR
ncbi:FAD-dependent monooxygenase [Kineococcus gynurae]|uniref:FAD-dependent monooxygenase n=1 Tax=Kineococcus gynurae TaxID=452979 RepID=A0ABV5LRV0_9ACTN